MAWHAEIDLEFQKPLDWSDGCVRQDGELPAQVRSGLDVGDP